MTSSSVFGKPRGWVEPRFWSRVCPEPNSGCWLWTGFIMHRGYGLMSLSRKSRRAHRVSYALFVGDPGDMFVCHACDVRCCVNPEHLWLGTPQQNTNDMKRKGRWPVGGASQRARVTDAQVLELRQARHGGARFAALSREFGISETQVRSICLGNSWAHLPVYPEPPGCRGPATKIDDAAVVQIRESRALGATLAELSARFGLGLSQLSRICRGLSRSRAVNAMEGDDE